MGTRSNTEQNFVNWYDRNIHITRSSDEHVGAAIPVWFKISKSTRYRILHAIMGVDGAIEMYNKDRKEKK